MADIPQGAFDPPPLKGQKYYVNFHIIKKSATNLKKQLPKQYRIQIKKFTY